MFGDLWEANLSIWAIFCPCNAQICVFSGYDFFEPLKTYFNVFAKTKGFYLWPKVVYWEKF